ncbi:hypothetical protein OE88DRAFT_715037 [Heliocybe sulcata]|uniref:Uncharacterized protein n=1 Tax=Heliocybe sulcata TaxID=5364 RepID=A0A5C3NFM5_9AGAM|nr:hypothetical protein OE88DRAFT_715037 [Heliocybe sulcata]
MSGDTTAHHSFTVAAHRRRITASTRPPMRSHPPPSHFIPPASDTGHDANRIFRLFVLIGRSITTAVIMTLVNSHSSPRTEILSPYNGQEIRRTSNGIHTVEPGMSRIRRARTEISVTCIRWVRRTRGSKLSISTPIVVQSTIAIAHQQPRISGLTVPVNAYSSWGDSGVSAASNLYVKVSSVNKEL